MLFFKITALLSALVAFAALSAASAPSNGSRTLTSAPTLPHPLSTSPLEWYGPSNGENITLYGTVDEIIQQLKARDPHWVPNNNTQLLPPIIINGTINSFAMTERYPSTHFCCPVAGQDWEFTSIADSGELADTMIGAPGYYRLAPNMCYKAGCNQGAGIYFCSNSATAYYYIPITNIGFYAIDIVNECPIDWLNRNCGQWFDDLGYNTFVAQC